MLTFVTVNLSTQLRDTVELYYCELEFQRSYNLTMFVRNKTRYVCYD